MSALVSILLALAFMLVPLAASAHTHFRGSMPAAGAELQRSPGVVMMHFSADAQIGEMRVLDAGGTDRALGAPFHPPGEANVVEVHLPELPRGQYGVVWRVVADDGHVSTGSFAFGVGVAAGAPPAVETASPGEAAIVAVMHFLLLAGMIAGAGLAIGGWLTVSAPAELPLSMLEFGGWIVLAFAAFADLWVEAVVTSGSFASVLSARYGVLHIAMGVAALLALAAIAGGRRRGPLLIIVIAVAIVAESLAGHGATGVQPVAGAVFDALHLLAAIVWIGVLLVVFLAPAVVDVRRTSNVATWAVGLLIVSSIVQVLRNVAPISGLITTPYGLEVCAKIVLFLVTGAVAFQSRRRVLAGTAAVLPTVRFELLLLTAVIAVTAVLVDGQPPR